MQLCKWRAASCRPKLISNKLTDLKFDYWCFSGTCFVLEGPTVRLYISIHIFHLLAFIFPRAPSSLYHLEQLLSITKFHDSSHQFVKKLIFHAIFCDAPASTCYYFLTNCCWIQLLGQSPEKGYILFYKPLFTEHGV